MLIKSYTVEIFPKYFSKILDEKNSIPYLEQLRVKEYSHAINEIPGHRRAIIPWSGGLDSTSCLLMAIESGLDIVTVNFNYGQDYYNKEFARIKYLREKLTKNNSVNWIEHFEIDITQLIAEVKKQFVGDWDYIIPFRNFIILMEASMLSCSQDYDEVWFGCVQGEIPFSGGDKSSIFLNEMKYLLGLRKRQLVTPLVGLTKTDLVYWACCDDYRYECIKNTVSCFSGGNYEHCGHCQSCFNRAVAFYSCGHIDDCGFIPSSKELQPFVKSYKKKLEIFDYYSPVRKRQLINFIEYLSKL